MLSAAGAGRQGGMHVGRARCSRLRAFAHGAGATAFRPVAAGDLLVVCTPRGGGMRTLWPAAQRPGRIGARIVRAQLIAEGLHADDREEDDTPLLNQIRRVVRLVDTDARAVAWLHEATRVDRGDRARALMEGLDSEELRALRLLRRTHDSRSDRLYLAHLGLIARAGPCRRPGAASEDRGPPGPPPASARPRRRLVAPLRAGPGPAQRSTGSRRGAGSPAAV